MTEVVDPAFVPLRNGVQFCVWRIQKLKLLKVIESDWGKFYAGDCYLVFDARHGGQHIFYWIGQDSTIDEQTVAAIKAVELDNMFNGMPVQHREVMGYESERFRKLFSEGVITLSGGADSGLTRVTGRDHQVRLFQVMGGKVPILREVGLAWSNMNHGDTFVLDAGSLIFIWSGESSSGAERISAASLAGRLRDRVGEGVVHISDGGEVEDLSEEELETWNRHLPLERRGEVVAASSDRKVSSILQAEISLYSCSDATGDLTINLVSSGNLSKDLLDPQDSFIIDALSLGIWIWLGRRSNNNERNMAMETGMKFIEEKNLSKNTKITKIFNGGEPEEFKSLFVDWS